MTDRSSDDPLMPIGMFSRASLVSVKSLRSYHEQGLLVPDRVDPDTGYRSYRVSQLTDAVIIKRLRDLDVPLSEVALVVHGRDPDVTHEVLRRQHDAMEQRLSDVERMVAGLNEALELPSLHTPVHLRDEPAVHALAVEGIVHDADYGPFLGQAFRSLYDAAVSLEVSFPGFGSARYPPSVDTDDEPVEAYLTIDEPVSLPGEVSASGVVLTMIPSARCAVATHVGGYESIGDTYRQLGAWVARHATAASTPIREHYVVSVDPDTGDLLPDDHLRTEIAWPVRRD